MTETPDGPGRYLDDQRRYRLESRIATGGMGEVWRATDSALNRVPAGGAHAPSRNAAITSSFAFGGTNAVLLFTRAGC